MFERFARSWRLAKASAAVLNSDRELLVLPIVSGICAIIVTAAFIAPLFLTGAIEEAARGSSGEDAATLVVYAAMFAFYVVLYFVILFFNTALVGAALERLEGGNPTLGSALSLAASRIGPILGYALIAATVGVILRFIGERFGMIGRIVEGLLGVAWTVTTFLVVPVIAARGVGPVDAIKQSGSMLRKTWGENIIGSAGMGLVFGAIIFAVAALGFGGAGLLISDAATALAGVIVGAITLVVLCAIAVYAAALGGVYSAAVYAYASGSGNPRGFDQTLLADAFGARKR